MSGSSGPPGAPLPELVSRRHAHGGSCGHRAVSFIQHCLGRQESFILNKMRKLARVLLKIKSDVNCVCTSSSCGPCRVGTRGADLRAQPICRAPQLLPSPPALPVHLGSWGHGELGEKRPRRQDSSSTAESGPAGARCGRGRGRRADTSWRPPSPGHGLRCGQQGLARGVLRDPRPTWGWGAHSPETKDAFVGLFFFFK